MARTTMQQAAVRRSALIAAAALVGAGGLAGEAILLSTAGLALGFGRASALGLAVFVAGYALGSWSAGRFHGRGRAWLASAGVGCALGAWLGVRALLFASAAGWSTVQAGALACVALAALGAVQGALLPALLRCDDAFARSRGVALFFAANLAGSIAGARWIGFDVVAASGRGRAALVAGATAALGALLAAFFAGERTESARVSSESAPSSARDLTRRQAALLAGLGIAWTISLEWLGLRHALLWLESQEATLNAVLTASLTALALGALLSVLLPRGRAGVLVLIPLAVVGTWWIALGAPSAHAWSHGSRYGFALVLLGPALLAFGAWIPALYRASAGEVGARLGDLLLHEAWGALLGAPLAHAWLVPRFGLGGALAALAALGAVLALLAAGSARRALTAAVPIALLSVALAVALARAEDPAVRSPLYADPSLTVRAFAEDAQFAVGVVDDGIQGERTLLTDRFRAAGTGRDYTYMQALGHLPLLLHPKPRRVAVMCLGTGTTLGAAFLHDDVEQLDVLEISPAVVAAAPWFTAVNHGALEPAAAQRVHVRLGDGRRLLADSPGAYDVVTMEPLLPDSPFGVYLYTSEFYAVAARALAPGGLVCQWVPPHALEPRVFDAVVDSFSRAFPWSGRFLFGSQLVLIGARAEPALDAARFPAAESKLGTALAAVNLQTPVALLTTFCGARAWPRCERELCDDAPWIVFEDKPTDARVFDWLRVNLTRVQQLAGDASPAWLADPGAQAHVEAGKLLLDARIQAAREEGALRGLTLPPEGAASASDRLQRRVQDAGRLGIALLEERRYLALLRRGVAAIERDPARAADDLLAAAELRPERADVHLYVAAALARQGNEAGARAAQSRAFELCPRVLETPAGTRASKFGLPRAKP